MTPERAREIARDVAAARRKWGKQVNPPYSAAQLYEVLELLDDASYFEKEPADLHAALVRIARQDGAAKAREKKSAKNDLADE